MRTPLLETTKKIGQKVQIQAWVNSRRDMGKIVFLDMRDRGAIAQVVVVPKMLDKDSQDILNSIRNEYVLDIEGEVQKREKANPNLATGAVEILAKSIKIIAASETVPFEVNQGTRAVNDVLRLQYRYLDLRSQRMRDNLKARHDAINSLRTYFINHDFWEIETPCLTKGTPEGSREYLVPSRIYPGNFYVLPQSPQQFKQLLMVAGVEKYVQIARCFRDEDQRGDRQPEFTQLDMEMSFATQEEILQLTEEALIQLVEEKFPHLKIQNKPFPRITYAEAMEKYQSDKPDLRKNKEDKETLAFLWVTDFPLFEYSETDKKLVSVHHLFSRPKDEDLKLLDKQPEKAHSYCYDIVLNGYEIGGGSLRIHEQELQKKIFAILGLKDEEIKNRFGHMLEAFKYGPPPHGGIALGLDRLIAILQGEDNIREVIAFPKTSDAKDLTMGAPSPINETSLAEANIEVRKKKK
jgi:aspartyl-tRNA synthetase